MLDFHAELIVITSDTEFPCRHINCYPCKLITSKTWTVFVDIGIQIFLEQELSLRVSRSKVLLNDQVFVINGSGVNLRK